MTDAIPSVRELLRAKMERARPHIRPFCFLLSLLLTLYYASTHIPPGWLTYLLSTPALLVLAVTALARLNDIRPDQISKRWQVRRYGMVMVGAASLGLCFEPLIPWGVGITTLDFPSWREVVVRWGIALVWITTPHMPPWWRYITGEYRTVREEKKAKVVAEGGRDPYATKQDHPVMPPEGERRTERRHGGDRREVSP